MFSVGDTVVYGTQGVCLIVEIKRMKIGKETKDYFVLRPAADQGAVVYVPCGSAALAAKMRSLISRGELDRLINEAAAEPAEWIADDNARLAHCDEVLKSGDRKRLLQLVVMLYRRRELLKATKKHFHNADATYLKAAERLLHDEFAYVLGIGAEEVPDYIRERIENA